jgi:hypothetical protein
MKRELIGYRLSGYVSKTVVDIVFKGRETNDSLYRGDLYFIKGHLVGWYIERAKELNVLETWFTPAYDIEIVPTDQESFKIQILNKHNEFQYLQIRDIHPGYGEEIFADLQFKDKETAEETITFLQSKNLSLLNPVDYKKLLEARNISFFYNAMVTHNPSPLPYIEINKML